MEKTYDPKTIEQQWYQYWEENDFFSPKSGSKPYSIMIPPPNVTGVLHMGHGFQNALMDALVRYHRMCGYKTLWQVGTDHAGIATQMVVERKIASEQNISRHDLGREAFLEAVWNWKQQSGNQITQQFRRLGSSVDWTRERFTMDENYKKAVNKVFISLYDEGLIYRGKRLVNWDPKFLTAISDLEVISEEEDGHLWYIRYPIINGDHHLVIATTRPETMLADVAIAVNPKDERYQQFIGKKVRLPLTNREIPIIADDYVDPDFGSGCVKITPAHDFNDYAIGQRHQLPLLNIFTPDARINENAPAIYQGMDRFAAREQIITDLQNLGLLAKVVSHRLCVPRGDRSGEVIEPYLTEQWYMKMQPLAEPALSAVKEGHIQFVPENWTKIYYQWLNNIEDWCISRQLWWGHQIPAWYDNQGNVYVADNEEDVRKKYQLATDLPLTRDNDVLDTWFSSALWPFATLGWPDKTPELEFYYPTSVLVSGFDIIFFWIARMIMMGLKFMGKVPFHQVYITGLLRDHEGQKMSKTKGNVLDPIDLIDGIELDSLLKKRLSGLMQPTMAKKIEQQTRKQFPNGISAFGTDALRFTYCALASTGRDIRFDLNRLEGYRNFCNKIWNAARYVLMNTEGQDNGLNENNRILSIADQWILSRLQKTILKVHRCFVNYRFDLLTQALYEFTWNEYCDWYLELSKSILMSEASPEEKRGTRHTLVHVLETLLRLFHPIMPFLTEEIWQRVAVLAGKETTSIMVQSYPESNPHFINETIEEDLNWLQQVIIGIRNIRGEMNIAPSKLIPVLVHNSTLQEQTRLEQYQSLLKTLAKLESITILAPDALLPPSATSLVGTMELLIPMANLIDKKAELERLHKEKIKVQKDLLLIQNKLNNANFVERAPKDVVDKERERVIELNNALNALHQQIERIEKL